jgi:rhamnosyltransferase
MPMLDQNKPRVLVLMASYNGLQYIDTQIKSIADQADCEITLLISVDKSEDNTFCHLQDLKKYYQFIELLDYGARYGSSAANFYRLILEANLQGYDFVAFSDQDDIWEADKLIRHIQLARQQGADGVSSNVIAFWPNDREKLINKAQPQRALDFLFESAGPGCTFLMTPWLLEKVRNQLMNESSPAKEVALHDWLAYAVCRAHGRKWVIDSNPSLKYRQHQNNVIGANVGSKAKWARLQKLKQGWYRNEVVKIVQICNGIVPNNETNKLLVLLNSNNYFSQLQLLLYIPKARRSLVDRCLLGATIVLGLF